MSSSPASRAHLARCAMDLLAARHGGHYEMFETVLDELVADFPPESVPGVLTITGLSLRKTAVLRQVPVTALVDGLFVHPSPAIDGVLGEVMSTLYLLAEDRPTAIARATALGADADTAAPAMVVLTDVSVAMVDQVATLAAVPAPQALLFLRQSVEHSLASAA